MNHNPNNLVIFLGRFHVLWVHLPIGGLVLLGFLEFLAAFTRWQDAARNNRWILGFVSASAVFTAACGWMLALGDGYDPQLLKWHRVAGLAVTGGCLGTFLLLLLKRNRTYRVSLGTTLLLLAVASHLGGSITHGRDFLTRYAPGPLRSLWTAPSGRPRPADRAPDALRKPVFAGVIQPILRQRCSACHGAEKHKGGLRLDTLDGLIAGGNDGPVIKPGHARDSLLIQRISLPVDDDDHMPPRGKSQLMPEQIELLEWWINAGAPVTKEIAELNTDANIRRIIKTESQQPARPE